MASHYIQIRAQQIAEHTVSGFILQDKRVYQGTVKAFTTAYANLFPELDQERVAEAGRGYADALFAQDEITTPRTSHAKKLGDKRWRAVELHLGETCEALGISADYARHHMEFFRLHSVDAGGWRGQCRDANDAFVDSYLGTEDEKLDRRLADMYERCVDCHDGYKNDPTLVEKGTYILTKYNEELLVAAQRLKRHTPPLRPRQL